MSDCTTSNCMVEKAEGIVIGAALHAIGYCLSDRILMHTFRPWSYIGVIAIAVIAVALFLLE